MKLHEIAKILGCELAGNGEIEITGVAGLDDAGPSELSFLANPRYLPRLKTTRAAAVILDRKEHTDAVAVLAALLSANPYLDFARALDLFYKPPRPVPGIHHTAVISPTASLGPGASIGPYVVIGDRV